MDFLSGVTSTLSSILELIFWYIGPFAVIGIVSVLWEFTVHDHYNKALTYLIFAFSVAMVIYPPWNDVVAGMEFSEGYNFITA